MSTMNAKLHGSPRIGRPPDVARAATRAWFSEWSERTFSSYWMAQKRLLLIGGTELFVDVLRRCTRPNGSISVAKLSEWAEGIAAARAVRAEESA
jgi:hypothetical protein